MILYNIKRRFTLFINGVRFYHRYKIDRCNYQKIADKQGIALSCRGGVKEYLAKWKRISKRVSELDYCIFSQYVGEDSNLVPEFVLHQVIEPIFLPEVFKGFYNDKNMYDKLLPKDYLAESLVRCIGGIFTDGDYSVIYHIDDSYLTKICNKCNKVIAKPTLDTGNGNSILLWELKDVEYVPIGHSIKFSVASLTSYYKSGNFVVQKCLEQSAFTAQFNETSVNTFRIFTYKSVQDNLPHVTRVVFRMGKKNSYIDNSHGGGRFIGVNTDGSFANSFVLDADGNQYRTFNGIDFSSKVFVVPDFDRVIAFSKSVSEKIFHNRTLDLDVMIDKDGNPKLIEFNVDMCSPWLYQFSTGSVFGKYTDEVIDYIESKLKNEDSTKTQA